MHQKQTFWNKPVTANRGLSLSLCIPVLVMTTCWVVLFRHPMLGFSEPLTPLFVGLEIFSWLGIGLGVSYFFLTQRCWHVIVCLLVNVFGLALNIYGFLFGLGMAVSAMS